MFSISQIAKKLQLSQSTVRYHLDKQEIQKRTISDAVTYLHITKFKKLPFTPKKELSQNDVQLTIAGIMLYWGEGIKRGGTVKFVNSNPEMIKVFLYFLRRICGIQENRLKALLHIYPDQNKNKLEHYWSTVTQIPLCNFYKTYIHIGKKGTYKKRSVYGTITINYSDTNLLNQILTWINEYAISLQQ